MTERALVASRWSKAAVLGGRNPKRPAASTRGSLAPVAKRRATGGEQVARVARVVQVPPEKPAVLEELEEKRGDEQQTQREQKHESTSRSSDDEGNSYDEGSSDGEESSGSAAPAAASAVSASGDSDSDSESDSDSDAETEAMSLDDRIAALEAKLNAGGSDSDSDDDSDDDSGSDSDGRSDSGLVLESSLERIPALPAAMLPECVRAVGRAEEADLRKKLKAQFSRKAYASRRLADGNAPLMWSARAERSQKGCGYRSSGPVIFVREVVRHRGVLQAPLPRRLPHGLKSTTHGLRAAPWSHLPLPSARQLRLPVALSACCLAANADSSVGAVLPGVRGRFSDCGGAEGSSDVDLTPSCRGQRHAAVPPSSLPIPSSFRPPSSVLRPPSTSYPLPSSYCCCYSFLPPPSPAPHPALRCGGCRPLPPHPAGRTAHSAPRTSPAQPSSPRSVPALTPIVRSCPPNDSRAPPSHWATKQHPPLAHPAASDTAHCWPAAKHVKGKFHKEKLAKTAAEAAVRPSVPLRPPVAAAGGLRRISFVEDWRVTNALVVQGKTGKEKPSFKPERYRQGDAKSKSSGKGNGKGKGRANAQGGGRGDTAAAKAAGQLLVAPAVKPLFVR